jgi:hypothetical protein
VGVEYRNAAKTNYTKRLRVRPSIAQRTLACRVKTLGVPAGEQAQWSWFSPPACHRSISCGFLFAEEKIVIELDESQHMEQRERDAQRTEFLTAHGYQVIRFWNNEVMNNMDGVIRAIELSLSER